MAKRTYSGSLRCKLVTIGVLLILASLLNAFSSAVVQQNQVYTQAAAEGSSFTALAASDVPFFNAGGFAPIAGSSSQVYSFAWWVFATDYLRPIGIAVSLVSVMMAIVIPLDSIAFVQVVLIPWILLEVAKVVYFVFVLYGLLGLSCESEPFCRNHNPAITATPDFSFYVALWSTVAFAVIAIAVTILPPTFRRAHLSSDPIGRGMGKRRSRASAVKMDDFATNYSTGDADTHGISPLVGRVKSF